MFLCWKWSHHGKSLLSAVERGDSRLAEQVHVYVRMARLALPIQVIFLQLSDDLTVGHHIVCARAFCLVELELFNCIMP